MIDLGLTKLAIIGAVALIVIGPKELPKVARMAGTLLGRAQRYIGQVKAEVSREMEMDDLRKMQKDVLDAAHDMQQTIHHELEQVENDFDYSLPSGSQESTPYSSHESIYALEAQAHKAKNFRRKKMAKTSNIPHWYKTRHGQSTQVTSGAARMAKHRVKSTKLPHVHSSFY